MKFILWPAVFFLALLIQGRLSILGVAPNLIALLAYFAGIRHGETKGLLAGTCMGALQDSLAMPLIGPHMLGSGMVGFLSSSLISGGFFRWTPLLGVVALCALSAVEGAAVFFSLSIFDQMPSDPGSAILTICLQALLNAPAGIFIRPANAD